MTRHEQLFSALQHNFGFDSFKGNQEAIINNLMDGHDTFVLMPTGGGRSIGYNLP
jgi:ATP-dependent DNA helicase RecQ